MKVRDLRLFTDIVNCADVEGREPFPVSEEHWMNKPVEGDEESNTLLMAAIRDHLHPYTEVLLKAGARADLYSQERGLAPIHHAVQVWSQTNVRFSKVIWNTQLTRFAGGRCECCQASSGRRVKRWKHGKSEHDQQGRKDGASSGR